MTGQGIVHRRHLAHVGTNVVDRYSRDRSALCVCRKLNVIGWPETTVGHLHHPRLRVGRGGTWLAHPRLFGSGFFTLILLTLGRVTLCRVLPRLSGLTLGLAACLLLLPGVQFLAHRQRRTNPPLTILGRPLAGRSLFAVGGTWIRVHLRTQIGQRRLGFAPAILQGRMPAKRGRSCRGAHPHPIPGHTIQTGDAGPHQRRETVHQQPFQHRTVIDAEIRQRFGIHADPAEQPLERDVLLTQPSHLARAANALHRGIQPKRQQNPGGRRRMAGPAVHRLDGGVKCGQVEPLNEIPHQTHPVIVRQQPIQARAPRYWIALGKSQPRQPAARTLRRRLVGQPLKQFTLAIRCHRSTFARKPNHMPILDTETALCRSFPTRHRKIFRL